MSEIEEAALLRKGAFTFVCHCGCIVSHLDDIKWKQLAL